MAGYRKSKGSTRYKAKASRPAKRRTASRAAPRAQTLKIVIEQAPLSEVARPGIAGAIETATKRAKF